ncbi:VOC family protein [Deinococcus sp. KSM4-11]|uniref:VOC family protein n=1 Tax=Deinococcus sp. KSM4-11 TaxID=2568654 RepID=UPI0010A307F6|nr:VOC family protein [Deinococcus sp. KSM4-11]THF86256.1 VOC family protein [Deinococcus sp. KSM4-11]
MTAHLDHLVIAARTLDEGRAWLEGRLGVSMQPGGTHDTFGTHNAVLSLGPDAYLEVVAVNPDAPTPPRPRWFALDTQEMRERLEVGPALIHWVASVEGLTPSNDVLELARGENRWRLTVAADGSLPMYGVAPSLIHWLTPPPPTRLEDAGVRLVKLQLGTSHPDRLRARLDALQFQGEVEVYEAPQAELRAVLQTPGGIVTL